MSPFGGSDAGVQAVLLRYGNNRQAIGDAIADAFGPQFVRGLTREHGYRTLEGILAGGRATGGYTPDIGEMITAYVRLGDPLSSAGYDLRPYLAPGQVIASATAIQASRDLWFPGGVLLSGLSATQARQVIEHAAQHHAAAAAQPLQGTSPAATVAPSLVERTVGQVEAAPSLVERTVGRVEAAVEAGLSVVVPEGMVLNPSALQGSDPAFVQAPASSLVPVVAGAVLALGALSLAGYAAWEALQ